MRIAQIAPLAESVPPKLYGGTERVVHWLAEELVGMGHEVTLFASGDSETRACLVAPIARAVRLGRPRQEPSAAYAALLADLAQRLNDFDIIHAHIDWLHLPLLDRAAVPSLTTLHGQLDIPGPENVMRRFPSAPFISISDNQRAPVPDVRWLGTVYHGMPESLMRPSFEPGSYLAFLGRLSPEKGPLAAISVAQRAGLPLRIAAKIPRAQSRYFKEQLQPHIDNERVTLAGEVDEHSKQTFLQNASALVFAIDWPEPFGLVMIEAMACGTPVIAFRRGSVPEIIEEGVTGFVVESEDEAVEATRRLASLDRRAVRAAFERRFTARRMAHDYVEHYRALLNAPRPFAHDASTAGAALP